MATNAEQVFKSIWTFGTRERLLNNGQRWLHPRSDWQQLPLPEQEARVLRVEATGGELLAIANQFETANKGLTLSDKLERYEKVLDLLMYPEAQVILDRVMERTADGTFYLVPVSSAAFGGMWLRDLAGTMHTFPHHKQDIDLVLVAKDDTVNPTEKARQIQRVIEYDSDADTRFTVCHGNPDGTGKGVTVENYHTKALSSADTVEQQLSQIDPHSMAGGAELHSLMNELSLFFYRSFPPEENQQARRVILQVMQNLYKTHRDTWEEVVRMFPYHLFEPDGGFMKRKYFSPSDYRYYPGSIEERALMARKSYMEQATKDLMVNFITDLLASTAN